MHITQKGHSLVTTSQAELVYRPEMVWSFSSAVLTLNHYQRNIHVIS